MSIVDSKYKLYIDMGTTKYTLPVYDGYDDFYNKKYLSIITPNMKERYIPITPSLSNLAINAGVEEGGVTYYLLTRKFSSNQVVEGGFFEMSYSPGDSNEWGLHNIISQYIDVPEDGLYEIAFNIRWAGGFNGHKNYRNKSAYQWVVKYAKDDGGEVLLADTGLLTVASERFYPYSTTAPSSSTAKWMTIDTVSMELKAGRHQFDLWHNMAFWSDKHAAVYISPFQVIATWKGNQ